MNDEWYTQPRYIEAARQVMGGIDLDPASCEVANQIVKAKVFYTKEQNGLDLPWYGRVWLNPPYGRTANQIAHGYSTIRMFTEKLVHSYETGKIEQGILLATTEVNAKWFQPLYKYLICIPDHRVNFIIPAKPKKYSQMFGTSFVYLGPNQQGFIAIFSQFGHVLQRVSPAKERTQNLELWQEVTA